MSKDNLSGLVREWEERSNDDTRRMGRRTVYGGCAISLAPLLARLRELVKRVPHEESVHASPLGTFKCKPDCVACALKAMVGE